LRDYKKELAKKGTIQMILTARFGEYTRFRSLYTSHMDFPHQQLTFPFLLPTLCVVSEPLEFLVVDIERIAFWSEVKGR